MARTARIALFCFLLYLLPELVRSTRSIGAFLEWMPLGVPVVAVVIWLLSLTFATERRREQGEQGQEARPHFRRDYEEVHEVRASSTEKPWWEILGVSESASQHEVKSAYRKLAMDLRPDLETDSEARKKKWLEVQAAYEVFERTLSHGD